MKYLTQLWRRIIGRCTSCNADLQYKHGDYCLHCFTKPHLCHSCAKVSNAASSYGMKKK